MLFMDFTFKSIITNTGTERSGKFSFVYFIVVELGFLSTEMLTAYWR